LTSSARAVPAWRIAVPAGFAAGLLAIAGAATNPLVPIALLLLAAIFVFAFLRPMWALYAAICLIPFESLAKGGGGLTFTPDKLMFDVVAVTWIARRLVRGELTWRQTPLTAPLALFTFSIVPGLLIAVNAGFVAKQLATTILLFTCFVMFTTEGEDKDITRMAVVVATIGAIVGALAIASPPVNSGVQTAGPFGQVNTLGEFLAIAIPIQLALCIGQRGRMRIAMLGAFAITLVGLTYSGSRGSFIGLVAMILVFLAWRPFRFIAAIGAFVLIALAVVNFGPLSHASQINHLKERLLRLGSRADQSSTQRFDLYRKTPAMIVDHPLFGVGAANYRFSAPDYQINFPAATGPFGNPHDTPLQIGAERGLLGLIALVWWWATLFMLCGRLLQRAPPRWRPLAFGLTATFVGQAIILLFEAGLPAQPIALEIFILGGVACLMERALENERRRKEPRELVADEPPPGQIREAVGDLSAARA
jgi:putative inorganic carbon (HCO3(-)) transporter